MVLGIQSLTVLMSVSLVICTGVIIGTISLTTSDDLLKRARDTGDAGVQQCLISGSRDIEDMTGRFLHASLRSIENELRDYVGKPERALFTVANYVSSRHPNATTDPNWVDTVLRSVLYSEFRTLYKLGADNLFFQTLWFSPNQTNTAFPEDHEAGYGWGSSVTYFRGGPLDDKDMVSEGHDPVTDAMMLSKQSYMAEVDELGRMVNTDKPCNSSWPNGIYGLCKSPRNRTMPAVLQMYLDMALMNYVKDEGKVLPLDQVTYHPFIESFGGSWMLVSHPFSHKDMYNAYPRQQNAVGHISSFINSHTLQEVLQRQELPERTLLYCVEAHHDGEKHHMGKLLGVNVGRSSDRVSGRVKHINVTAHTDVQGSGEPSVIAMHGVHVFSMGGYVIAALRTNSTFDVWRGPRGVEYWTVTAKISPTAVASATAVQSHYKLTWFVTMLVPRASVMETIDASNARIRSDNQRARDDSDKRQRESFIIMICITVAVVTVLLVCATVFTRLIVAPLHRLADDMENVAVMNLEAVSQDGDRSRLSEVSAMQKSFDQMVQNLLEYRNYMPQSVLAKDDTETETEAQQNGGSAGVGTQGSMQNSAGEALPHTQSKTSSNSGDSAPSSRTSKDLIKGHGSGDAMKRRSVSVAYFNVKDWHKVVQDRLEPEFVMAHQTFLHEVLQTVQKDKGYCEVFLGDRILATFNAFSAPVPSHRVNCIRAAVTIAKRNEEANAISVSYACTSGDSLVGNMGVKGMKKATVIATTIPWVVALERYNRKTGGNGMADAYICRDVTGHVVLKCRDALLYTKRSDRPIQVYEVKECNKSIDEEWMYQLQGANLYEDWNAVFSAMLRNDFAEAEKHFAKVSSRGEDTEQMRQCIKDKRYTPITIDMH